MEKRVVVWTVFFLERIYQVMMTSDDDKFELKYDTNEIRLICSKLEKATAISLSKSVKLILFKGQNIKEDFWATSLQGQYKQSCGQKYVLIKLG